MGLGATWREWNNPDGTKEAILMFPEEVSEEEALAELGMDERGLVKKDQRHFPQEKFYVCEYVCVGDAAIKAPRPERPEAFGAGP